MTDETSEPAPGQPVPRTLVFVSRQRLLAGTLARLFVATEEGWSIDVLDTEDPDLIARCRLLAPDVVVVDVDNEVLPGISLVGHLSAELPGTAVLVLGELDGAETARAINSGAKGVMTYAASPQQVHEGITAAAAGRTAVAPVALSRLIGSRRPDPSVASDDAPALSARERDILRRLVVGMSTRAIAAELAISVQTVRKHTQNILNKLGVHSKLAAAAIAVRDGLV